MKYRCPAGPAVSIGSAAGRPSAVWLQRAPRWFALGLTSVVAATPWPALAQASAPKAPTQNPPTVGSLVVVGKAKPKTAPGAVIGDIKPEVTLGPGDIMSYGVSTVDELLNAIAPQTRSDQGRTNSGPVILVNGRRISDPLEISSFPVEAIQRVEVLPEEVALKYGYAADQRVINIVLRRFFRARTIESQGSVPTEGGEASGKGEYTTTHIRGDARSHFDLRYSGASQLLESARGLATSGAPPFSLGGDVTGLSAGSEIDPALSALAGRPVLIAAAPALAADQRPALADFLAAPTTTDLSPYRTLSPATQSIRANGVWSNQVPLGLTMTVNAALGASTSRSLQGLPGETLVVPAGDPYSPFSQAVLVNRYTRALGALRQQTDTWTAHLGATLNRDLGDWRLSVTTAYDHSDQATRTDQGLDGSALQALLDARSASFDPFAGQGVATALPAARARQLSDTANLNFLASGPALRLPAGPLGVSFEAGDVQSELVSTSRRLTPSVAASLARNDLNARFNADIPVASRRLHVLGWLGDLSLNANISADQLSDFGLLRSYGYGVNWKPVGSLSLLVSHTDDQAAPTPTELAGPAVLTPGVPLLDFVTGTTTAVSVLTGGDRRLTADDRDVFKAEVNWKPFAKRNLSVVAQYLQSHTRNPTASFPTVTGEIEAAFPERFRRDADGQLTEVDERPLNFAWEDKKELRWGLNLTVPIGKRLPMAGPMFAPGEPPPGAPPFDGPPPWLDRPSGAPGPDGGPDGAGAGQPGPGGSGAPRAQGGGFADPGRFGPPGGFGGPPPGGFGGPPPGFPGAGQLQFALYHTLIFEDRVLVRQGGPVLDFLDGAAVGPTGGQPRQELEAQAGYMLNGLGVRLSADWKSATTVRGGAAAFQTLQFSDIGTVDVSVFELFGPQQPAWRRFPFLRGARVTLAIKNLFDTRERVRDAAGATPPVYEGPYLDPLGRTVSLSFRKLLL